jgi:ubiquinone/menaquinone biosynthesis C-methylase UbiE
MPVNLALGTTGNKESSMIDNSRKYIQTDEVISHYTESYDESNRLTDGFGQLERARTEELISRFLPKPPAVVVDVGGASGIYSFFMAGIGYEVHLVDIVPKHIDQAKALSEKGEMPSLASMHVGDARSLDFADSSIDSVVMHGPLYHLVNIADRRQALSEAWRVLRPGGVLLAFGITRYAGAIYGIIKGLIYDAEYMKMIRTEVETGLRTNPPDGINTLPNAVFHLPKDLQNEVEAVGLICKVVIGVVGPAWLVPEIDSAWHDPIKRETMMAMARMLEKEPVLGPRILAVGMKPV